MVTWSVSEESDSSFSPDGRHSRVSVALPSDDVDDIFSASHYRNDPSVLCLRVDICNALRNDSLQFAGKVFHCSGIVKYCVFFFVWFFHARCYEID